MKVGPWSDEISALIRKDTGGNSLVVQWLGLSASTATALVQSLAGVEGGGRHEDSLPLPPSLPQFLPLCVCVCVCVCVCMCVCTRRRLSASPEEYSFQSPPPSTDLASTMILDFSMLQNCEKINFCS